MSERTPIIVGNWKMNKNVAEAKELVAAISAIAEKHPEVEVGVAPPFTALTTVAEQLKGSKVKLSAQNCHYEASGAFTGEISVSMLKDAGCTHVIIGHSERRQYFNESDELISSKAQAVLAAGLVPIICVGERLEQREAGKAFDVVGTQLAGALSGMTNEQVAKTVIAYEPVWAIGTGKTASNEQAQEVHAFLRKQLATLASVEVAQQVRIQYGGSVNPSNVAGLMSQPDVDGALVGGASLKPDSFAAIIGFDKA